MDGEFNLRWGGGAPKSRVCRIRPTSPTWTRLPVSPCRGVKAERERRDRKHLTKKVVRSRSHCRRWRSRSGSQQSSTPPTTSAPNAAKPSPNSTPSPKPSSTCLEPLRRIPDRALSDLAVVWAVPAGVLCDRGGERPFTQSGPNFQHQSNGRRYQLACPKVTPFLRPRGRWQTWGHLLPGRGLLRLERTGANFLFGFWRAITTRLSRGGSTFILKKDLTDLPIPAANPSPASGEILRSGRASRLRPLVFDLFASLQQRRFGGKLER